jgi:beta-galactosidase
MIKNLLLFVFVLKGYSAFTQQNLNNCFLFDNEWKFFRGGVERGYFSSYNDSSWRTLNLPHDFSIEDIRGTNSPFDPDAISQVGGGFTTGGTGWYRKKFRVPDAYKGKNVRIIFDGVYMNADVWVNNISYETHAYGYTSFYFDISASLVPGDNIIAVQVKNEGPTSRWYSGTGIYRHVWIEYLDKLQLKEWGTHVTCSNINSGTATINISTAFENKSEKNEAIKIVSSILNQKGELLKKVSSEQSSTALSSGINKQQINISKPILWSVDQPFLYKLVTELYAGAELKQRTETKFGIRDIQFDAAKGFLLNGKMLKLKGGCFHNDNGPLGAASFDRAEIRRAELMKASGFNAIRCSHNPPSPSFLDACDELGILVIDEAFDMWEEGKNPYDYHLFFKDNWRKDVQNMIERDMNHPSIILWSIGNEIPNREKKEVVETGRKIAMLIRELDSTRPITG